MGVQVTTGLRHNGTEVRIAHDGRVWVLVPAGVIGASARWKPMPRQFLSLDCSDPQHLISPVAKHSVEDLGLDARGLSHLLGIPRRDPSRVTEMWSSRRFTRGALLAIDFAGKELAPGPATRRDAVMVFAFSAFRAIKLSPRPVLLSALDAAPELAIGDFPVPPAELARAMGLPTEQ